MPRQRRPSQTPPVFESPSSEAPQQSQCLVEKIRRERQSGFAPDPFALADDYAAGIRLFESRQERLMVIKFEEKPSPAILKRLKDCRFRWNPREKVWVRPIRPEAARVIRIEAERLYDEVREMIREEKGLESDREIPF